MYVWTERCEPIRLYRLCRPSLRISCAALCQQLRGGDRSARTRLRCYRRNVGKKNHFFLFFLMEKIFFFSSKKNKFGFFLSFFKCNIIFLHFFADITKGNLFSLFKVLAFSLIYLFPKMILMD